jgi:hypothetical protein
MKWFLAKLVYQIICGDGDHTAQFDEQLRLVAAEDKEAAFAKAVAVGEAEAESFYNQDQVLVRWKFIHVPELYALHGLTDGAEVYSRIREADDAAAYITFVQLKAAALQDQSEYCFI